MALGQAWDFGTTVSVVIPVILETHEEEERKKYRHQQEQELGRVRLV